MVQVLIKALDILELVAQRNGQPVSLTEISDELQLNQATAANIIKTLITKSYLEHIGKKKGYRLGPAAYRLTNEVPYSKELVNASIGIMEELSTRLNESCILGVLRNQKRYILHAVHSKQEVQVNLNPYRNVYETASGRILLAYLNEKELNRFVQLNGMPDTTIWEEASTWEGMMTCFEKIRQEGLSTTHINNRHVRGFGVPIFSNEQVVAGLSIFLPEYRCTAARQRQIVQGLKLAALDIGQKLT